MKHRGSSVDADLLRLRELSATNEAAREALVAVDAVLDRGAGPRQVRAAYREALAEARVDENAATELDFFAENTGELYPQFEAIIANLKKKITRGVYDSTKAWKLWAYWYNAAAAQYAREFGGGRHFPPPLRRMLAKRRAVDEYAKISAGEYGPVTTVAKRKHRGT